MWWCSHAKHRFTFCAKNTTHVIAFGLSLFLSTDAVSDNRQNFNRHKFTYLQFEDVEKSEKANFPRDCSTTTTGVTQYVTSRENNENNKGDYCKTTIVLMNVRTSRKFTLISTVSMEKTLNKNAFLRAYSTFKWGLSSTGDTLQRK